MKNVPEKIYLNIGAKGMADDFKKLSEVTYSKKRIHEDDICYKLSGEEATAPIDSKEGAEDGLRKELYKGQINALKDINLHHQNINAMQECAPLSNSEVDGWVKVKDDLPPVNTIVHGFSEKWVDLDFNEEGIRECFVTDENTWISADWDNCQDCWFTDDKTNPTFWKRRYPPKQ